ncbi:hypothetical protein C8J56DRAFT_1053578 [Mycena floridula]|nr:hypothetical protein C8J56DRAFT_1053578 [Mycena floridula]
MPCRSWFIALYNNRFSLPLFQNITHLEFSLCVDEIFDAVELQPLINLKHFSLAIWDALSDGFSAILSNLFLADSIQVCILSAYFLFDAPSRSQSQDPRIVFALPDQAQRHSENTRLRRDLLARDHFIRQWGRQKEGEIDMWEEAEGIVAVQRALQTAGRPFSDRISTP